MTTHQLLQAAGATHQTGDAAMTITHTTADVINPRASWTSSDGLAIVSVFLAHDVYDDRGAQGWSYYIAAPTDVEGVSVGYTFASDAELIYTPGEDVQPLDVLETLSGFIGAWAEARDENSDNWTLFPASARGVCDYADELAVDAMNELTQHHYDAGTAAGTAAGSWVIDGNTSSETAAAILAGYDNCDPEVMDLMPSPLSGEFAGESMVELLGGDADDEDAQNAYESGFADGFWAEVQRSARAVIGE